ncbi:hypothetical protein [Methylobacterium organophilum]|uniref:Secreted protein n=1 Tax=Methylobacterium organophilum TaxID=410 RepID=A0ABQ4T630_METOR|nr:hypothetical protein [Methylobacterium organophilum]UMY16403.1 hypothetical protein MMB17_17060 [Methylobacterium organophilum]GJE27120.1 hypothetical protein LKMONMHP_1976 [Methylobacterium organophilum]
MRIATGCFWGGLAALSALVPLTAEARGERWPTPAYEVETTGSVGGRAPWNQPWEYDSGSGNDRRPELPYYQQGRGQQTGGPARNLLPDDGLHLFPQ